MNGREFGREEGRECVVLGDTLGDTIIGVRPVRIHADFGRAHSIVPRKRGAVRRIEIPTLPIFDAFTNEQNLRLLAECVSLLRKYSTFIFCMNTGRWVVVRVSTTEDRMG